MFEILQYNFVQRALIAGSFIGVSCAVLGVFLVLRRLSLIGEGLAHFSLAPIGLGLMIGVYPLYIAIPMVAIASFGILGLMKRANMYGDAAIGLFSTVGVAFGVIMASVGSGFNVDLYSYLFGDVLAVSRVEVIGSSLLSLVVLLMVAINYQELFAITFDEEYATVMGLNSARFNYILVLLTSITVVLGIKVVGVMLVSSLIVFPAVTALQLCKSFKNTICVSICVAVLAVVIGIALAFVLNIPAGAAIVITSFSLFVISFLKSKI